MHVALKNTNSKSVLISNKCLHFIQQFFSYFIAFFLFSGLLQREPGQGICRRRKHKWLSNNQSWKRCRAAVPSALGPVRWKRIPRGEEHTAEGKPFMLYTRKSIIMPYRTAFCFLISVSVPFFLPSLLSSSVAIATAYSFLPSSPLSHILFLICFPTPSLQSIYWCPVQSWVRTEASIYI